MDEMEITVFEISDKELSDGAKVRDLRKGTIRTIKVLKNDKDLYQSILDGEFDPKENVEYDMVMNNKHLFELIHDEDESSDEGE